MKRILLFLYVVSLFGIAYGQNNPLGTDILVMFHDTTITSSQTKRLPDRDTLMNNLTQMLSSFNVAMFDTSSNLSMLGSYKSVIMQETSFDAANARYMGYFGRNAMKNWLLGGTPADKRTLIIMGGDLGYNYSRTGSAGQDLPLAQDILKFTYKQDTGTLTGMYSIEGVGIDAGNTRTMTNSPAGGGYYPDSVTPLTGSTVLYKYSGRSATDSVAAVGIVTSGYIALSIMQDPRYFSNGSFYNVLFSAISFAIANGGSFPGFVPVELTSFASVVVGTDVRLSWATASELNNQGFEVQRSTNENNWQKIGFVQGQGTTTETNYYSYTDKKLATGHYNYRLKQIDLDGTYEYSNVVEADVTVPLEYSLQQNFPNPFNPSTKINFSLAADSKVVLKIFDVLGQEVLTLVNGDLTAGIHEVSFDAASLNSGVYLYRLDATGVNGKNFSSVKKMILSK